MLSCLSPPAAVFMRWSVRGWGDLYKQVTCPEMCVERRAGEDPVAALWPSPTLWAGGTFLQCEALTAPTLALDGPGALTASGHCLGAEGIKATPSLIRSHSWGQNVGLNQQLLLATVQMLPVGIGFTSGPTSCFDRLLKAWEPGAEAGWVCLLLCILHQLHTCLIWSVGSTLEWSPITPSDTLSSENITLLLVAIYIVFL